MPKTRPWTELKANVVSDPASRAQVEEGVRAIEDGIALGQLRSKLGLQELDPPEPLMDVQAPTEDSAATEDIYLATLRGYIEAMGGRMEINAVFPDGTLMLVSTPQRWVLVDSEHERLTGSPAARSMTS